MSQLTLTQQHTATITLALEELKENTHVLHTHAKTRINPNMERVQIHAETLDLIKDALTAIEEQTQLPTNLIPYADMSMEGKTDALAYMDGHNAHPIEEYFFYTRKDGRINQAYKWPAVHKKYL